MTRLCEIAEKYLVDKCPEIFHYYTPEYHELFKDYNPKKFLEIGIGNYGLMSHYCGENYERGASLKMWREYFKDCNIYGCDIIEDVIFQEDRISTIVADQSNPESLENMMEKFGNMDVILDDGSHFLHHQLTSIRTLWKYVNDYYIIEDIYGFNEYQSLKDELDDCEIVLEYKHEKDCQGFIVFKRLKQEIENIEYNI